MHHIVRGNVAYGEEYADKHILSILSSFHHFILFTLRLSIDLIKVM